MKSKIEMGNISACPGEKVQGYAELADTGIAFPLTLINGDREGGTVILSSGLHGGEYTGIETAIELAQELMPEEVRGQLAVFHPVNVEGFFERVSYVYPGSGENLNRYYPGKPAGTVAERAAFAFTHIYQSKADFFVDLHGGDLHEHLPPYVYYPGMGEKEVIQASYEAALMLNASYIVESESTTNAYSSCAFFNKIPSLLIERGGRGLWTREEVEEYKADLKNLLRYLKILDGEAVKPKRPARKIAKAKYVDAGNSGCWYPSVHLEEEVREGQLLGVIKDFFGNVLEEVRAEFDGIILFFTVSLAVRQGDPIITYGI